MQRITPFLWYDKEAGEAAKFYCSVFKGSKIKRARTLSDTPSGTVEVYTIEILGQEFTLMSAGPLFKFNESISFIVNCRTQKEIDYYWKELTSDGGQEGMCGWLKDKYGVSWQVTPVILEKMLTNRDKAKVARVTEAFLKMKKFDIPALKEAYNRK